VQRSCGETGAGHGGARRWRLPHAQQRKSQRVTEREAYMDVRTWRHLGAVGGQLPPRRILWSKIDENRSATLCRCCARKAAWDATCRPQ
jgi:hypothetical protein